MLVDVLLHGSVCVIYLSHFLRNLASLLVPNLSILLFLCDLFAPTLQL